MDFRPLAMLNTDYIIFTRLHCTRLRAVIGQLIHDDQNDFVPGRTIHETIDLLDTAQQAVNGDEDYLWARALLLDFAKAYDTLDRQFMYDFLHAYGFPKRFIRIIRTLHTGTVARFQGNGKSSRAVASTGPRLSTSAPALHPGHRPLYRLVQHDPDIEGITLRVQQLSKAVKIGGYADVTTVYAKNRASEKRIMEHLAAFGSASGLERNVDKCVGLPLHRVYPDAAPDDIATVA